MIESPIIDGGFFMYEESIAIIKRMAPPFRTVDSDLLLSWVEMADMLICKDLLSDDYDRALALLTLHIATAGGAMKATGTVNDYSTRVSSRAITGAWSKSYKDISDGRTGFDATQFGQMYEALLLKHGGGFGLIVA